MCWLESSTFVASTVRDLVPRDSFLSHRNWILWWCQLERQAILGHPPHCECVFVFTLNCMFLIQVTQLHYLRTLLLLFIMNIPWHFLILWRQYFRTPWPNGHWTREKMQGFKINYTVYVMVKPLNNVYDPRLNATCQNLYHIMHYRIIRRVLLLPFQITTETAMELQFFYRKSSCI